MIVGPLQEKKKIAWWKYLRTCIKCYTISTRNQFYLFFPTKPFLLFKVILKLKHEERHKIQAFQYLVYSCYFRVITLSLSTLTFAAIHKMLAKMHTGMHTGSTAVKEGQRMSGSKKKQTEEFPTSCSFFHLPPYPDFGERVCWHLLILI